jgi:hypothetical protein
MPTTTSVASEGETIRSIGAINSSFDFDKDSSSFTVCCTMVPDGDELLGVSVDVAKGGSIFSRSRDAMV